ncbi:MULTISPECIES: hypothetical protein [unclassified Streptomyces]|uniref:hypothetical protein n=1 Tax=unclassified Streptomyces TaxID=2593676 RepID=UPI00365389A8
MIEMVSRLWRRRNGRGTTPAGPGGATTAEPWHVLEDVPEGHEEIPGLLRGLVTPGSRRVSWDRLEPHLGWWQRPGILRPLLARLLVMLPELDRRHRIGVLDVVRRTADALRAGSHRPDALLEAVLVEGQRAAAALLSDDCPEVRAAAAGAVEHVRAADPAMFEALRRQADVESDPYALGCHLLAAGEVLAALGTPAPADWWESWLHHADPHVRLTARTAHLTVGRAARLEEADARRGRSGRPAPHQEAVERAGELLRTSRYPPAGTWETVLAGLAADDILVVGAAAKIIARAGTRISPYTDLLLPFAWRDGHSSGDVVKGLIGAGDPRALPLVLKRSHNSWLGITSLPVRWAQQTLPALRVRLAGDRPEEALRILAGWGPAGAPAARELIGLLDTPHARAAAAVLGGIGPAAGKAAGLLSDLARGDLRPRRFPNHGYREPQRWHGTQTAAWAHWRITGDPRIAVDVIGAALRTGRGRVVLSHLADLGPLAAGFSDDVAPLLGSPGEWTRVGAAGAWWRLTGDADTAVATLLPELRRLSEYAADPLILRAVDLLGSIGRPAAAAVPALTSVTTSERRYGASILLDEELCRGAHTALAAIG